MKEQIKAPKKYISKQWRDSQPIRCRVQNTGNQVAHRNGWVWSQNRGKMKAMKCEIKENLRGTNSDGKEIETQINELDQEEERHIQPGQNEETRIQKNEESLRNLWDNFKCFSIWIIGVLEEEEEQEIENLPEQIMRENFPNLAKEIDFQGVQEAQRIPQKLDPRRNNQGTS